MTTAQTAEAVHVLQGLASDGAFPGLAAVGERLRSLVTELEHGAEAAYRPFRILLTGGTGVGKSTLLNALAGEDIAPMGERRPTTSGFTAYLHVRDEDPWLLGLPGIRLASHERESLAGKVLLDAPDADSAITEHRTMLENALALTDLVLVVVTDEKYLSAQVLRLLAGYREGREFAFVFNKIDIADASVVDDFKQVIEAAGFADAEVFAVSARNALRRRMGDTTLQDGQFEALSALISESLNRARLDGIVRSNLAERAALASRMVRGALPEGWESVGENWREACVEAVITAYADTAGSLRRTVLVEDDLTDAFTAARGASFTGVFGFFAAIVYGLRRLVPGAPTRSGDALDSRLRMRMDSLLSGDDRSDDLLREDFALRASGHGLDQGVVRELIDTHADRRGVDGLTRARLPMLVSQEFERLNDPPGRIWSAVANLPAWAWIGYWVVRTMGRVLAGLAPEWDAFTGAAVVLVVGMGIQCSLVHRVLRYSGRRRARRLVSSVLSSLETEVLARHGAGIDAVVRRVQRDVASCKTVLDALDGLVASGITDPVGERTVAT